MSVTPSLIAGIPVADVPVGVVSVMLDAETMAGALAAEVPAVIAARLIETLWYRHHSVVYARATSPGVKRVL